MFKICDGILRLLRKSFLLDLRQLFQALSFFVRTWVNRKINYINMYFENYWKIFKFYNLSSKNSGQSFDQI